MNESQIQKDILAYLRSVGLHAYKMNLGPVMVRSKTKSFFAKNPLRGFPDIFILHDGKIFCIEVKSAKGKLRPDQVKWHAHLGDLDIPVIVARSVADVASWIVETPTLVIPFDLKGAS